MMMILEGKTFFLELHFASYNLPFGLAHNLSQRTSMLGAEVHLDIKIFYSPFCREEGVLSDLEVDYFDNAPCIELLTCQVCCNLCFLSVGQVNAKSVIQKQHNRLPS